MCIRGGAPRPARVRTATMGTASAAHCSSAEERRFRCGRRRGHRRRAGHRLRRGLHHGLRRARHRALPGCDRSLRARRASPRDGRLSRHRVRHRVQSGAQSHRHGALRLAGLRGQPRQRRGRTSPLGHLRMAGGHCRRARSRGQRRWLRRTVAVAGAAASAAREAQPPPGAQPWPLPGACQRGLAGVAACPRGVRRRFRGRR
mmetsp:Transcript_21832/g.58840  ORF Transcript_21832/g.58840 Transcript_21832/m.58840 type:complete len:202 (+) Transcript_21832:618-1223(+)